MPFFNSYYNVWPERNGHGFSSHLESEICRDTYEIPLGGAYALEIPDCRIGIDFTVNVKFFNVHLIQVLSRTAAYLVQSTLLKALYRVGVWKKKVMGRIITERL
jgi:hypothetical protein